MTSTNPAVRLSVPCLIAEGSFPRYLAGGRKRDHLPHTTEKRPLFLLVPTWGGGGGGGWLWGGRGGGGPGGGGGGGGGGGTLMLGNSGRGLDPRGVERCEGKLPKWQDAKAKVQN